MLRIDPHGGLTRRHTAWFTFHMDEMMDRPEPRTTEDLAIEIEMTLEFLRSNPSPEVARQYALDSLRQASQRSAREMLDKLRRGE